MDEREIVKELEKILGVGEDDIVKTVKKMLGQTLGNSVPENEN